MESRLPVFNPDFSFKPATGERFDPKPDEYYESDKNKCVYDCMCFLTDVSGSTNNSNGFRGGSRGRGRFESRSADEDDKEETPKSNTKCIILAEMEAVSNLMSIISNNLDCSGKRLIIISFSSETQLLCNVILDNSKQMYDYALRLDEMIYKSFGGTDLTNGLAMIEKYMENNTLCCIATDGRANNQETAVEKLDDILQKALEMKKLFDLVVIGAGSIKDAEGGSRSEVYGRQTKREHYRGSITVMDHGSECNVVFLKEIAKHKSTRMGIYLPACNRYEELISQCKKAFGEDMKYKRWWTVLDGGSRSYFSDEVQETINYYLKETSYQYIVIKNEYGTYLLSCACEVPYQMHLYGEIPDGKHFVSLTLQSSKIDKLFFKTTGVFEEINDRHKKTVFKTSTGYSLSPSTTPDGFMFRIRQLRCE